MLRYSDIACMITHKRVPWPPSAPPPLHCLRPPSPFVLNMLRHPGADCSLDLTTVLVFFGISLTFWKTLVILLGYLGVMHLLTYGGFVLLGAKEQR